MWLQPRPKMEETTRGLKDVFTNLSTVSNWSVFIKTPFPPPHPTISIQLTERDLGKTTASGLEIPICTPTIHAAAKSLQSCPTLRTIGHQALQSMGFSRQGHWSGLPCSTPGDLPDPGIEPAPLMSLALVGRFFITSATWEAHHCPWTYFITCHHPPQVCLSLQHHWGPKQ